MGRSVRHLVAVRTCPSQRVATVLDESAPEGSVIIIAPFHQLQVKGWSNGHLDYVRCNQFAFGLSCAFIRLQVADSPFTLESSPPQSTYPCPIFFPIHVVPPSMGLGLLLSCGTGPRPGLLCRASREPPSEERPPRRPKNGYFDEVDINGMLQLRVGVHMVRVAG